MYLLNRGWNPGFLWILILPIISHIFPENFIETPQIVQKIWRISLSSMLAIFIDFHRFFGFFEISLLQRNYWRLLITNDVKFFLLIVSLNRLFKNCIKFLYNFYTAYSFASKHLKVLWSWKVWSYLRRIFSYEAYAYWVLCGTRWKKCLGLLEEFHFFLWKVQNILSS